MSILDDFKTRFAKDCKLPLDEIEACWSTLDPNWYCYYCFEYGANDCTDEAILNLIAHLWTVENASSTAPIKGVASKSWQSESVTYATSSDDSDMRTFFNTSIYGQRFLRLIHSNQGGFFV
jgi:hypothetical protein